jgi:hypothetical protein
MGAILMPNERKLKPKGPKTAFCLASKRSLGAAKALAGEHIGGG